VVDIGTLAALPIDSADIDADGDSTEQIDVDFDLMPRVYNDSVDLGAFEYNGEPPSSPITFVNINATGTDRGASWTDAYTDLQSALSNACATEIWIAAGTYFPVQCGGSCQEIDREESFYLRNEKVVYGGFDGTETMLSQRDYVNNKVILSGDIGVTNDSTDNSYRVVVAEGVDSTAVLDGLCIEEGNADGSFPLSSGGGMYIDANPGLTTSPTIRNCTFRNNYGGGGGRCAY